jgi:protein SCO1/2
MILAALALALQAAPAASHDGHQHHQATAKVEASSARVRIADNALVSHEGKPVRLADLMSGKRVVVLDFVYTTCTTVCPVLSATLAKLQDKLGPRMESEVQIISISIDPQRDTPARLKEYAARHGAGPGWVWLTGAQADVDAVLKGFGAYTPNPADHPAMVLVGRADSGAWTRLFGFPGAAELLAQVDKVAVAQAPAE